MSNNPYEHRRLFCQEIHMRKSRFKIKIYPFPGLCLGITFPMDYYTDMSISVLCFNISIKWRRR